MQRLASRMFSVIALCSLIFASSDQITVAQQKAPNKGATKTAEPMTQAPAQQQWTSITIVRVKPDMVTDYEDFVKNETLPMQKKAGLKWRSTFQTAFFGESYEYVIATPIESFAQYDGQGPALRALGQEGARAYGAKLRKFVVSSHTYATLDRPDLSFQGTMTGPPKFGVVNIVQVTPGRAQEFESLIKNDVMPALKKAGVPGYFVSQTVFGGNINEYVSVTLYDSMADIGKGSPLVRVWGQEGFNKFVQKTVGVITNQERLVTRYISDLSFMPAPATEKK